MFARFEKLVHPYPDAAPEHPPKSFFAFLWSSTRGLRPYLLAMTLLTAVIGVFEAMLFSMLGNVVDWLATTQPQHLWAEHGNTLFVLGSILIASPIVITLWCLLKYQGMSGNFPMLLRWNFHRLMLGQSMSFYQDEFAGRISTKVMQTALAVRDCWMIVSDILVFVTIYFITMVAIVGTFDVRGLIPFAIWLVLYIATLYYFVPRLGKIAQEQADARSLMTGRITDAYTNIATVKLFSHTQRESTYARGAMQEFLATVHTQWRYVTQFEVINHTLSMLLIGGTAFTTLWLWSIGEVGPGAVAAATAMALRLNGISHWVMWELAELFEHVGTVRDGMSTLTRLQTVVDPPNAATLEVARGEVVFDNVSFAYGREKNGNDVQEDVIRALNLRIKAGEKIGLVGRSGAGKSTIVNLLLRFYDVREGRILIDGHDISQVTQVSLRTQIGMVTQDTSLLHRSVRDNIVYGRPHATEEEMIQAALRAEAHEFIVNLQDPKGRRAYDAHVGERGVKLSGGQRQRIAIARVMLKDAPILLLDEATSALDSEVESAIQQSLYKLMEGKTVIAIAHRLSTIAAMDRLIVMDRGRVVEEGDHRTLLAKGGLYARLWEHQSGGFLGETLTDEEIQALQS